MVMGNRVILHIIGLTLAGGIHVVSFTSSLGRRGYMSRKVCLRVQTCILYVSAWNVSHSCFRRFVEVKGLLWIGLYNLLRRCLYPLIQRRCHCVCSRLLDILKTEYKLQEYLSLMQVKLYYNIIIIILLL